MQSTVGPSSRSQLTFLHRDSVSSYATAPGLVVCFGRNAPSGSDVAPFVKSVEQGIEQNPGGAALIIVVNDTSTPEPSARQGMKRVFPALLDKLVGTAFVLRSRGFASAAQRAVITAILLATGNRKKLMVTSEIKEAIEWAQERLPASAVARAPSPELMAREIDTFCDEELSAAG